MRAAFSFLEQYLRIEPAVELDHLRDHTSPAGLMVRAQAGAVVPVEVLVELHVVAPMRIGLEFVRSTVHRTLALCVPQKNARKAVGNFLADLEQADGTAWMALFSQNMASTARRRIFATSWSILTEQSISRGCTTIRRESVLPAWPTISTRR